jgi:septal ring factor EnvC (AmiA/AmiB activator)
MSHDEKRRWSIALVGLLATWLITIVSTVWALSADRTQAMQRIEQTQVHVADHEERVRSVEKQMERIATDVKWIRDRLEKGDPLWR